MDSVGAPIVRAVRSSRNLIIAFATAIAVVFVAGVTLRTLTVHETDAMSREELEESLKDNVVPQDESTARNIDSEAFLFAKKIIQHFSRRSIGDDRRARDCKEYRRKLQRLLQDK